MYIEQMYTGCLAHAAYYIESNGQVAIIDPLRDYKLYLNKANQRNAQIKYIFETHFHADFVSGHLELAQKTNAKIVFGPLAKPMYDAYVATDGEVFELGNVKIKLLHTPGHTMESSCFLLINENNEPHAVFTGDTLFIGDVGRPDLAVKSDLSKEDLAGHLYDSIHNKLLTLPDGLIIYPGHGAGSACGKNLSKETTDTIGNQRKTNYALRQPTKDAFVQAVTDGLMPPPYYFPINAQINKQGYSLLDTFMETNAKSVSPEECVALIKDENAIILDTRKPDAYLSSHVKDSLFIGIDGDFAPWAGTVITNIKQAIVVVAEPGREEEIITRLARVGYENVKGFLAGGVEHWKEKGFPTTSTSSINAAELLPQLNNGISVIDVRKQGEFEDAHLTVAKNMSLAYLQNHLNSISPSQKHFIHCAGGYRSVIAISILERAGFNQLVNVAGGFNEIKKIANAPITAAQHA